MSYAFCYFVFKLTPVIHKAINGAYMNGLLLFAKMLIVIRVMVDFNVSVPIESKIIMYLRIYTIGKV